jgi:hypothetical protein
MNLCKKVSWCGSLLLANNALLKYRVIKNANVGAEGIVTEQLYRHTGVARK